VRSPPPPLLSRALPFGRYREEELARDHGDPSSRGSGPALSLVPTGGDQLAVGERIEAGVNVLLAGADAVEVHARDGPDLPAVQHPLVDVEAEQGEVMQRMPLSFNPKYRPLGSASVAGRHAPSGLKAAMSGKPGKASRT